MVLRRPEAADAGALRWGKAFALRYQIELFHADRGVVCEENLQPELRLAWSLAEDLLSAAGSVGGAQP